MPALFDTTAVGRSSTSRMLSTGLAAARIGHGQGGGGANGRRRASSADRRSPSESVHRGAAGQRRQEAQQGDKPLAGIAGEALEDPVIKEATEALKTGAGIPASNDAQQIFEANKEILTLNELIAHRLVEILLGLHRGRKIFAGGRKP